LRPVTFFVRVPEFAQEPSDGGGMGNNPGRRLQGSGKFRQRDVTVLCDQVFQKHPMGCKLALAKGRP